MASIRFKNVYIEEFVTLAGPYEKAGLISNYDYTIADLKYNCKKFEDAEIKMQEKVISECINKSKRLPENINVALGGDLLNQITTSSMAIKKFNIPFLGVYNACATFTEELLILSNLIDSSALSNGIVTVSSHNLTSERQFRYPVEYGSPKVQTTTFTATGAVCALLSNKPSKIRVESATIGRVVDYDIKDVTNMGAVMAPSAATVIHEHLLEMNRDLSYYDIILTGDIGEIGSKILKELYKYNYGKTLKNHIDAGTLLYKKSQNLFSGASGPATLPLAFFTKIIATRKFKKILLVGTGSLHSPTLVNQKNSIPSISHAVSLEVK